MPFKSELYLLYLALPFYQSKTPALFGFFISNKAGAWLPFWWRFKGACNLRGYACAGCFVCGNLNFH